MGEAVVDLSIDDAYDAGRKAYGISDECPFSFPDLKHWWWSGWFDGLVLSAMMGSDA